ncbi:MAG TPA: VOC family protein, partial [Caulobacteraceae bacterium]|nr:VOC family protein [Caulobacteraceae bacterium]
NAFGLTLDHVTIGVADFDKEIDWYHRALGLQPNTVLHTPKFEAQKMTGPGIRIDLIHQDGSVRPTPTMGFDKQGYMHVALVSPDLQTLYDHLTGMGVAVEANRDKSGKLMVITFQDPEGNAVEVLRN